MARHNTPSSDEDKHEADMTKLLMEKNNTTRVTIDGKVYRPFQFPELPIGCIIASADNTGDEGNDFQREMVIAVSKRGFAIINGAGPYWALLKHNGDCDCKIQHSLYSTDGGVTWNIAGVEVTDETQQVVE
jgi:hypothetical protein